MSWASRRAPAIPGVLPNHHRARRLFDGIASAYAGPAEALSFGQYGRWRRFAASRLRIPSGSLVLDVATGTGLVARDVARATGARVVGIDISLEMLERARARGFPLVRGTAEHLPFPDEAFDAVTFTYLLRYVEDPKGALAEMARVLRPGGPMISVEFGVPDGPVTEALWRLYALHVFPVAARPISPGWREVGEFLGPSISAFAERFPRGTLESLWESVGMREVRARRMSFGAGVVTWGVKR